MTQAPAPVADPAAGTPTPTGTPAPTSGGAPPAGHPPAASAHDGDDDDDLTPQQRSARSRRRLQERADQAHQRATVAEQERDQLRSQVDQLTKQNGSVVKLRESLLAAAVRGHASTLVIPEALDDAIKLLDVSDLKVGDDGAVDADKVRAKVEKLVEDKPYLARAAATSARTLPGGHQPGPSAGSNAGFNQLVRRAAGRE